MRLWSMLQNKYLLQKNSGIHFQKYKLIIRDNRKLESREIHWSKYMWLVKARRPFIGFNYLKNNIFIQITYVITYFIILR